ncbi:SET and MYND domain-containing protein 4 [Sarcoptes scabiei]|uniref:Protein-lysine N-methyltransferase SMYD4 n=1 Tax=Sarcoptes scabiei TaxID=52283 RepID=A0A834RC36_SARSC|nr:SET and MYND domain-containing protein 4 [Sarcoptes scabiei]
MLDNLNNEEGWQKFGDFCDSLASFINSESKIDLKKLEKKLQTDRFDSIVDDTDLNDQIAIAVENFIAKYFSFDSIADQFGKDQSKALFLMKLGDDFVEQNNYLDALRSYSDAILIADMDENQNFLMELFERRARIFLKLNLFQDCLEDLLLLSERSSQLVDDFISVIKDLDVQENFENDPKKILFKIDKLKNNINEISRENIEKFLKKFSHLIQEKQTDSRDLRIDVEEINNFEQNSSINGASSKISLAIFDKKHRGYRSNVNLSEDETLFIEKPFTIHFLQTKESYCANCCTKLSRIYISDPSNNDCEEDRNTDTTMNSDDDEEFPLILKSFVPCYHCNRFKFCDEQCRQEAWNDFHRNECQSFLICCEEQIGNAYLIARMIVANSEPVIKTIKNSVDSDSIDFVSNIDTIKSNYSRSYQTICDLITHPESLDAKTKICYYFAAMFLQILLKKLNTISFEMVRYQKAFLKLLLHHFQQLPSNIFNIFDENAEEFPVTDSNVAVLKNRSIGTGLYANLSLFNHSCDPNCRIVFFGSKIIVKTIREISSGEEICISYGPTYSTMNLYRRSKWLLQQYNFVCECQACVERKESFHDAFLCPKCYGPTFLLEDDDSDRSSRYFLCRQQHRLDNVETILENFQKALDFKKSGEKWLHRSENSDENHSGESKSTDECLVESVKKLHQADLLFNETIYCLNSNWIQLKNSQIDCYLKMGHYDRARICSKQIIASYNRYPNDRNLLVLSLRERIRLIKICWLLIEELDENRDHSDLIHYRQEIFDCVNFYLDHYRIKSKSTSNDSDLDFCLRQLSKLNIEKSSNSTED